MDLLIGFNSYLVRNELNILGVIFKICLVE